MLNSAGFIVIMAGGQGTRLWPLSRPERPKQFLPLLDGASLLQATWHRARKLAPPERVLVVGSKAHRALYHEQLPDLPEPNLLLEPASRNTAPCLTLAALHARRRHPESVLVVQSADHLILNESEWETAMLAAAGHAEASGRLVAIGKPAEAPVTRFGYLLCGDSLAEYEHLAVYAVRRFVEKPERSVLEAMLAEGRCLRNMGMFAWRSDVFLEAVQAHQPTLAEVFQGYRAALGTSGEAAALEVAYERVPKVSVDHGILQQSPRVSVVQTAIRRIDVGDFSAFAELWPASADGNVVQGRYAGYESRGNIIYASGVRVATVGLHDHVVVAEDGVVLVCPKDRTQDIKKLYQLDQQLQREHGKDYR